MLSVTVGSCGIITQKKYESEVEMNPQLLEHCKKFLLCSVSCPGLPSFGYFQELQNTIACTGCQKTHFYLRKIEKKKTVGSRSGNASLVSTTSDEVFSIGSDDCSGSSQNQYFCPICYVYRFCNVHTFQNHDGSEIHYIFKEKGSGGGILYQSSPIIERISDSRSI